MVCFRTMRLFECQFDIAGGVRSHGEGDVLLAAPAAASAPPAPLAPPRSRLDGERLRFDGDSRDPRRVEGERCASQFATGDPGEGGTSDFAARMERFLLRFPFALPFVLPPAWKWSAWGPSAAAARGEVNAGAE